MYNRQLFLFILSFSATLIAQQSPNPLQALNQVNQNIFIPNKGQCNPEVKYLARVGGRYALITTSSVSIWIF